MIAECPACHFARREQIFQQCGMWPKFDRADDTAEAKPCQRQQCTGGVNNGRATTYWRTGAFLGYIVGERLLT